MKKVSLIGGLLGCAMGFIAVALSMTATPSHATEDVPEIRFYNRTESVGTIHSNARQDINFKKTRGFRNDEARMVTLINIKAGTRIYVFDNSPPSTRDDWTVIYVKKNIDSSRMITVKSFEKSFETDTISVAYHRKNGLDGKVSYCQIRY